MILQDHKFEYRGNNLKIIVRLVTWFPCLLLFNLKSNIMKNLDVLMNGEYFYSPVTLFIVMVVIVGVIFAVSCLYDPNKKAPSKKVRS